MSGGVAFVLDLDERRVNPELVDLDPVEGDAVEELHALVTRHAEETGSTVAAGAAGRLGRPAVGRFTEVMPRDYKRVLETRGPTAEARPARTRSQTSDGHGRRATA